MYLIPNLCTTGNLFCGVFAILSVFNGQHLVAAIAILVGMIFDMLDGKLARLTNSTGSSGSSTILFLMWCPSASRPGC